MSSWETLELSLVEEIMLYLDLPDILESGRVCSRWYSVVQDKTFWKKVLKNYREHNEDNLELVPVLEPYLLYKRLYKMEHAKTRAVVSSSTHMERSDPSHDHDMATGVQFSNSGQYVFSSSFNFIILWRQKEDTGSFEILKKLDPPDEYSRITGFDDNCIHNYRLFNDSGEYILIIYRNCITNNFMVHVYSIPDCCMLKNVQFYLEHAEMKTVCWFGRYTFLVEYIRLRDARAVFILYSVNEEFEPHMIYTHYFDEDEEDDSFKMTVLNDNNKNEKIIVCFKWDCHQENYQLHILRATSDFSGELFGVNTSSCLTERKFSSPDPKQYSCSLSLTKTVDFEVKQFSESFPGKIAMVCKVCIPETSDTFTHKYTEIRLYDFHLNHLHTFPVRATILDADCECMFYIDQHSILTFDDMYGATVCRGKINYFDIKHRVGVDINTGHSGSIRSAAFSPTNPDILCSMDNEGDVKFFDFSV